MNTVYPNRRKRFTASANIPAYHAVDIGGGFWGFLVGEPTPPLLNRDTVHGVDVFGSIVGLTPLQIRKTSKGFLLTY